MRCDREERHDDPLNGPSLPPTIMSTPRSAVAPFIGMPYAAQGAASELARFTLE